mgnify:CR=1 FL=1
MNHDPHPFRRGGTKVVPAAAATAIALAIAATIAATLGASGAGAAEKKNRDLPPGPIADRVAAMEAIGKDAKVIAAAVRDGKPGEAEKSAADIASAMKRFATMFPDGSTAPGSRAKADIWSDRQAFDDLVAHQEQAAEALAAAAKAGEDLHRPSTEAFADCKSCHDQFREPSEDD